MSRLKIKAKKIELIYKCKFFNRKTFKVLKFSLKDFLRMIIISLIFNIN